METQKIANLWVILIVNLQNLQQENGMLSMIKIIQTFCEGNEDSTTVKLETKVIKGHETSSLM